MEMNQNFYSHPSFLHSNEMPSTSRRSPDLRSFTFNEIQQTYYMEKLYIPPLKHPNQYAENEFVMDLPNNFTNVRSTLKSDQEVTGNSQSNGMHCHNPIESLPGASTTSPELTNFISNEAVQKNVSSVKNWNGYDQILNPVHLRNSSVIKKNVLKSIQEVNGSSQLIRMNCHNSFEFPFSTSTTFPQTLIDNEAVQENVLDRNEWAENKYPVDLQNNFEDTKSIVKSKRQVTENSQPNKIRCLNHFEILRSTSTMPSGLTSSISNEDIQASSVGNVPPMKGWNEYIKNRYPVDLHNNFVNMKSILKPNKQDTGSPQLNALYGHNHTEVFPSTSTSPGLTAFVSDEIVQAHSIEKVLQWNDCVENNNNNALLPNGKLMSKANGEITGNSQSDEVPIELLPCTTTTFPRLTALLSNEAMQDHSTGKVSPMKEWNDYAKNRYNILLPNAKLFVKPNQEIAGSSQSDKVPLELIPCTSATSSSLTAFIPNKAIQAHSTEKVPPVDIRDCARNNYPNLMFMPNGGIAQSSQPNKNHFELPPGISTTSPGLTPLIANKTGHACFASKVPSMRAENEVAKNKYQTDLQNLEFILKSRQGINFHSNPKNIHRIAKKRSKRIEAENPKTLLELHKKVDTFIKSRRKSQNKIPSPPVINLEPEDDVNSEVLPNVVKIKCNICFLEVDTKESVKLQDCKHSFCNLCFATAVQFPNCALTKCPYQRYGYSCDNYLLEGEVKALLTPEVYERYLQRRTASPAKIQDQGFILCKSPDCFGWCFYVTDLKTFQCNICHHTNCITCNAIHDGKTCVQYQNECLQDKLHKEFEGKETYRYLIALDDVDLVANTEQFECSICFVDIDPGQGATLRDCLHSFCKECLAGVIQHSETATVKCPFKNDEYSCESHLQEREVKALISPEAYEKYLQRSVSLAESQAQNSFHCKTPDCHGWCLVEDGVNIFLCPVCNHTNCLTCAAIHEGMNCRQYQDDVAFRSDTSEDARRTRDYLQNMLNNDEAMKCPQCKIILMKMEGCDWLKCSMCKTEVCWVTKGPRWGPAGFGDTSGGCKCKLNGNFCHPNCRGCH